MCRLLGVVVSERADFRFSLHDAPRSLAHLSREHPHGWGVGVWDRDLGWQLEKNVGCAGEDSRFSETAARAAGEVLIAHVRFRTVGPETLANTHPFARGRWLFAHNGTIDDVAWLRAQVSARRTAELEGATDSELFFAFLLTRLDRAGITHEPAGEATDRIVADAVGDALARTSFGAVNFLLSDGEAVYAHRYGRTLHLLARRPGDTVRTERGSAETGAVLETSWTARRHALLVASEQLTDEPWAVIEEGTLLRIDRAPAPRWRTLRAS
jgi:glutamine amidotransferase